MRIAFLGLYSCFGHEGIGGTESVVRRLAYVTAARGHKVGFVRVNAPRTCVTIGKQAIVTHDVTSLAGSLATLAGYEHIVTVYLPPRERLAYARFRYSQRRRLVFHALLQNWPEAGWKRALASADRWIYPYNGCLFCVSPRLHRAAKMQSERAILLWPPVPDEFFLTPVEKQNARPLRVTYMGRLDPSKGARIAVDLFYRLASYSNQIETRVYGYAWSHDEATRALHRELEQQKQIVYVATEQQFYSPEVDRITHAILTGTDVLFLPYQRLSSTIDVPLVVLEGMAHLCAIVTRPLGDLPQVYGQTRLMFHDLSQVASVERVILELAQWLPDERQRLFKQIQALRCQTSVITDLFLQQLEEWFM